MQAIRVNLICASRDIGSPCAILLIAIAFLVSGLLPGLALLLSDGGLRGAGTGAASEGHSAAPAALAYPCEGHHCGCVSREGCLAHCCCYPEQEEWLAARAVHDRAAPEPTATVRSAPAPGAPSVDGSPPSPRKVRVSFLRALDCWGGPTDGPIPLAFAKYHPPPEAVRIVFRPGAASGSVVLFRCPESARPTPPVPPPRTPSML